MEVGNYKISVHSDSEGRHITLQENENGLFWASKRVTVWHQLAQNMSFEQIIYYAIEQAEADNREERLGRDIRWESTPNLDYETPISDNTEIDFSPDQEFTEKVNDDHEEHRKKYSKRIGITMAAGLLIIYLYSRVVRETKEEIIQKIQSERMNRDAYHSACIASCDATRYEADARISKKKAQLRNKYPGTNLLK